MFGLRLTLGYAISAFRLSVTIRTNQNVAGIVIKFLHCFCFIAANALIFPEADKHILLQTTQLNTNEKDFN